MGFRDARFRSAGFGCPGGGGSRNVVPASAGSGFCTRQRLGRSGLNAPVGVVPVGVVAVGGMLGVAPVGVVLLGGDDVRVNLIGFAELLLRRSPHAFGFRLLLTGVPPQPFRLNLGLFGIGLGTGGFGLAVPRSKLVCLGFFTHFRGALPVRLHFSPPVEEQHRCDDCNHHNNADNDPHKLS